MRFLFVRPFLKVVKEMIGSLIFAATRLPADGGDQITAVSANSGRIAGWDDR